MRGEGCDIWNVLILHNTCLKVWIGVEIQLKIFFLILYPFFLKKMCLLFLKWYCFLFNLFACILAVSLRIKIKLVLYINISRGRMHHLISGSVSSFNPKLFGNIINLHPMPSGALHNLYKIPVDSWESIKHRCASCWQRGFQAVLSLGSLPCHHGNPLKSLKCHGWRSDASYEDLIFSIYFLWGRVSPGFYCCAPHCRLAGTQTVEGSPASAS